MKRIFVYLMFLCAPLTLLGGERAPVVTEPEDTIEGKIDSFYAAFESMSQVVDRIGRHEVLAAAHIEAAREQLREANHLFDDITRDANRDGINIVDFARRLRVENINLTRGLPEAGVRLIVGQLITARKMALAQELSRCSEILRNYAELHRGDAAAPEAAGAAEAAGPAAQAPHVAEEVPPVAAAPLTTACSGATLSKVCGVALKVFAGSISGLAAVIAVIKGHQSVVAQPADTQQCYSQDDLADKFIVLYNNWTLS